MIRIEEVEEAQADLDRLYAELATRKGEPEADAMLILISVTDQVIVEARKIALNLNMV